MTPLKSTFLLSHIWTSNPFSQGCEGSFSLHSFPSLSASPSPNCSVLLLGEHTGAFQPFLSPTANSDSMATTQISVMQYCLTGGGGWWLPMGAVVSPTWVWIQFDRNIYAQKAARPPCTSPRRGSLKALFISKNLCTLSIRQDTNDCLPHVSVQGLICLIQV